MCVTGVGTGDGRDLIVKFLVRGDLIFEARFGSDTNCTVSIISIEDGNSTERYGDMPYIWLISART